MRLAIDQLTQKFVFECHESGGRLWTQCVKSHKKSLEYLKCFAELWWILQVQSICHPQKQATCPGQIPKISKHWDSLNDYAHCIWFTADIYLHIAHVQVLMDTALRLSLYENKQKNKWQQRTIFKSQVWLSKSTENATLTVISSDDYDSCINVKQGFYFCKTAVEMKYMTVFV